MGVGLALFCTYLYHLFEMRQQIYTVPLSVCVESVKQGSCLSPRTDYPILTRKQAFPRGKGLEFPLRAQELCESRGARPELPVPNYPSGLCGRKATLNSCIPSSGAV